MTSRGHSPLSLFVLYGLGCAIPLGCGGLIEGDAGVDEPSSGVSTGGSPLSSDGTSTGGTGGHALEPGTGGALSSGGGIHLDDESSMAGAFGIEDFGIVDPEAFCDRVCSPEALQDPCIEQAACYPGWCLAQAETWDLSAADAFEKCVTEEPLCFQSIEGCMLDVLYPPTALRTHILVLENLEPDVVKYIYAGALPPGGPPPLFGDTFTTEQEAWLSWSEPWESDLGPNFYAWIDVDQDGLCESAQDLFGVAVGYWNGSFDVPTYEAHLSDYFDDGAAACPVLGFLDEGTSADEP